MLVLAVHFFCYADPGCAFFCFASLGCDFLFCIFVVMQILIVQGSSRQLWSVPLLLPVDLFFSTTFWSHCRWYDTLQPPGSSDFSSTCNSSLNNIQLQQPSQNIFAPPPLLPPPPPPPPWRPQLPSVRPLRPSLADERLRAKAKLGGLELFQSSALPNREECQKPKSPECGKGVTTPQHCCHHLQNMAILWSMWRFFASDRFLHDFSLRLLRENIVKMFATAMRCNA